MSGSKKDKKSPFSWDKGGVLDETNYEEVADVGQIGRQHVADSVPADANLRVRQREEKFKQEIFSKTSTQAPKSIPQKEGSIGKSSDKIKEDYKPGEADHLIEKSVTTKVKNIFEMPSMKKTNPDPKRK